MINHKRILSLSQIINLNFGTLGILFAWELEIANVSGIFSFFGAKASDLGYLWLSPSIIGMLFPLIIGYLSDRTFTSFGKRLPYIFWGAVLTAICMLWLPNASTISLAVILLCIFTAGINASLQPFKPLVADVVSEREHTKVYAIQAALIGVGATAASIAPWFLLVLFGHHATKAQVPFEIKISFYIGAIMIFVACLWTTITTRPYLPNLSKSTVMNDVKKTKGETYHKASVIYYSKNIFSLFSSIPKIMWQVSFVQFFTWMGAFCFIVYLTPAIEQAIFNVPVGIQHLQSPGFKMALEKSVVLNGICCAIYMGTNIIYAYIIPFLSKAVSRKNVHIISLAFGGLSLLSFIFIHHTPFLFISMIGIGMAWASFNSLPFAMVANAIPNEKLGIYMGLFNVAICLPQIIVSLCVSFVLNFFLNGNAVMLMLLSGASMLIAAILTFSVKDKTINEIV